MWALGKKRDFGGIISTCDVNKTKETHDKPNFERILALKESSKNSRLKQRHRINEIQIVDDPLDSVFSQSSPPVQ